MISQRFAFLWNQQYPLRNCRLPRIGELSANRLSICGRMVVDAVNYSRITMKLSPYRRRLWQKSSHKNGQCNFNISDAKQLFLPLFSNIKDSPLLRFSTLFSLRIFFVGHCFCFYLYYSEDSWMSYSCFVSLL